MKNCVSKAVTVLFLLIYMMSITGCEWIPLYGKIDRTSSGNGNGGIDTPVTPVIEPVIPEGFVKIPGARVDIAPHDDNYWGTDWHSVFSSASSNPVDIATFYLAETEVTYKRWYEVYQWAVLHGYLFVGEGRQGNRGTADRRVEDEYVDNDAADDTGDIASHDGGVPDSESNLPVSRVCWRDAVVWCNAASEMDGLTPVYYWDGTANPAFTTGNVLRRAECGSYNSHHHGIRAYEDVAEGSGRAENSVINPNANGYRLPTEQEWEFAARGGVPSSDQDAAWNYTYPGTDDPAELSNYVACEVIDNEGNSIKEAQNVKSKLPNSLGLYDMVGNMFEWCFNSSSATVPNGRTFRSTGYDWDEAGSWIGRGGEYGPLWQGCNFGFRVARSNIETGSSIGTLRIPMEMVTVSCATITSQPSEVSSNGPFITSHLPRMVDTFKIAETELSYAKWYEVKKWAENHGYSFANPGRQGSSPEAGTVPTTSEPVTGVSWRDAVVWCNAASEMDGFQPVYRYNGTVVRVAESSSVSVGSGLAEQAAVDPTANGYRLPTEAEWEFAARGGNPSESYWNYNYAGSNTASDVAVFDTTSVAPGKTKAPNSLGLYDMCGNILEWCQDISSGDSTRCILKGGHYESTDNYCKVTSTFGESLSSGDGGAFPMGFRVVQTVIETTPLGATMIHLPGVTIPASAAIINPDDPNALLTFSSDKLPMDIEPFYVGETEVTYSQWTTVRLWSESHGYSFANKGFSSHFGNIQSSSMSVEVVDDDNGNYPVYYINWRDAVVWCNAASEREGLTPVYWLEGTSDFTDKTKVLRVSQTSLQAAAGSGYAEKAVINPNADGYRLPSVKEWEFAARGGNPWLSVDWQYQYAGCSGSDEAELLEYANLQPTGGTSTPFVVKTLRPNAAGLYDMSGNVAEWIFDSSDTDGYKCYMGGAYNFSSSNPRSFLSYNAASLTSPSANKGFRLFRSNPADTTMLTGIIAMCPIEGATVTSEDQLIDSRSYNFTLAMLSDPIIINGFVMGETEITFSVWKNVKQWAENNGYSFVNDGCCCEGTGMTESNTPVTQISPLDAALWCNAASEMEGLEPVYKVGSAVLKNANTSADSITVQWNNNGYRLPTEIEWEFAAHGGVVGGSDWNKQYAAEDGNNVASMLNKPVKTYAPNAAGLYDMSGLAGEWCWNNTSSWSWAIRSNISTTAGSGQSSKVWINARTGYTTYPGTLYDSTGFRVVRTAN